MGCDIHTFIEVRENGTWKYYDWEKEFQDGVYEDGSPRKDCGKIFYHPLHIGRNYDLFAILASVRNDRRFAGIKTSEGLRPIEKPRGLPLDVTLEVKEESDRWDIDGHSHSYMLLSELLTYDYDGQSTTQYGVVGKEGYQEWKEKGYPSSYSDAVSGGMVRNISNAEMDDIIAGKTELDKNLSHYTQVQWQETYREAVGESWFRMLEELAKLGSPDNVRLVFWFDN